MEVRTRFAPSPTGYLHIGGARTALFNWLFARHNSGKLILRIEDTDVARSTEESTKAILDGMEWLGLRWDEGPYYQAQRFDLYREHATRLLEEGKAYRCYCTPEELEKRRNEAIAQGKTPKYDGRCRGSKDVPAKPYAVRFIIPPGKTLVKDIIKGNVVFDNEEIEDLVILRSDNTPTYNLCVVVDDATMKISHVIRGDDHLNNTPKQILLYEAMCYTIPEFAHLPMILGHDRTRLSKRHGATSVMAYKELGYLPEALVNYLARLGWSYGDQEIFTIQELIEKFSFENVGKSSGIFNPDKLLWLNQHYIKETPVEELSKLLTPFLKERGFNIPEEERLLLIVNTLKERSKTLVDMAEGGAFYFVDKVRYDEKGVAKFFNADMAGVFEFLMDNLETTEPFTHTGIEDVFAKAMEYSGLKLGKIAQPVRLALTGGTVSPGIFEVIEALGREKTLSRLRSAIDFIHSACGSATQT